MHVITTQSNEKSNNNQRYIPSNHYNHHQVEGYELTDGDTDLDEAALSDDINDLTHHFLYECDEHVCCRETCGRVTINVAGLRFETQMRTLHRLPETLLGNDEKRRKFWDPDRGEYFFDRHRPSFPAILFFYQSGGRLVRPMEVPTDVFLGEIQFFEMGKSVINSYMKAEGFISESNENHPMPKGAISKKIWEFLEYPETSLGAKIFAGISVAFIVISVVSFCVETLPQYRNVGCINVTTIDSTGKKTEKIVPDFGHPLAVIESVCITWFVLELIFRFIVCPSRIVFVKSLINWIDVAAILPYFVYLFMYAATGKCDGEKGTMAILRVLRVTRILKLSKHSEGLRILGKTLRISMKELFMFVLFLGIGIIIFSGAMFYAEQSVEHTQFTSIPATFWWAVVSMTTVGYGDMYPEGVLGKLIGSMTVLMGLLTIALPVPVIVTNFNNFYSSSSRKGGNAA